MELITFICTIIGAYVAILTYKKTFPDQAKEDVDYLVSRYLFAKDLNKKILDTLNNYASNNQSYDQHFMQGITFQKAIYLLEDVQNKIFNLENDQLLTVEMLSNNTSKNIKGLQDTLDTHIKHLCEVQTYFNFYFEPLDKGILS